MFVSILSLRWSFRELWRPVRHVRPCIISYATPILQSRECVDLRFWVVGWFTRACCPRLYECIRPWITLTLEVLWLMIMWLKGKISIIVSTCFAKLCSALWFSPLFTFTVIVKSSSRIHQHRHYHGNWGFAAMLFLYYWIVALRLELRNLHVYLLPKHPFDVTSIYTD